MSSFAPRDVYNLAAQGFDLPALRFWSLLGEGLVRVAALKPGENVLDIGCGTGAASLPAAAAVAPNGTVVGVDIAEKMIARARERAASEGLANASFEVADLLQYSPGRSFEVILGSFSLFFFDDVPAILTRLRAWTLPAGRWAFSFWGERSFEGPARTFKQDVETRLPGVFSQPAPWERFSTPEKIRGVFAQAGYRANVSYELPEYFLASAEEWWDVVMNSGYRKYVEMLPAASRAAFRENHLARIRRGHTTPRGISLYLPTFYAVISLGSR